MEEKIRDITKSFALKGDNDFPRSIQVFDVNGNLISSAGKPSLSHCDAAKLSESLTKDTRNFQLKLGGNTFIFMRQGNGMLIGRGQFNKEERNSFHQTKSGPPLCVTSRMNDCMVVIMGIPHERESYFLELQKVTRLLQAVDKQ